MESCVVFVILYDDDARNTSIPSLIVRTSTVSNSKFA